MGFTADAIEATGSIVDALGDLFTITRTVSGSGSTATVTGVFDNDHFVADQFGEIAVDSRAPILDCLTSEVADILQGDSVDVDSVTYLIETIEPDTHGLTRFRLRISDA